jgi:acylphosphatase
MQAQLAHIAGRVQGVGYRNFVQREAVRLGLRGYAKNLADGRVEVLAMGPAAALDELTGLLHRGPRWAEVRLVEIREAPMLDLEGFHIR